LLLPRLRPEQRHPPRPDPRVQDWPGLQPGGPNVSLASAGASHAAQDLTDRALPAVEAGQLCYDEGALATTTGGQAIDSEVEPRQLM
jgi:hypothetical protein